MSREICFLCFVQHGAGFWKCLWHYFGLSKRKPRKKISRSYLQTRKMEKWRQKEFLTTWECLNCKKSSQQFPSSAIARRDSNSLFCIMLSRLRLKKRLNYNKKLYPRTVRRHKAREGGDRQYMGYIGVCCCEGYGFQAVYSRIGYINQSVWV